MLRTVQFFMLVAVGLLGAALFVEEPGAAEGRMKDDLEMLDFLKWLVRDAAAHHSILDMKDIQEIAEDLTNNDAEVAVGCILNKHRATLKALLESAESRGIVQDAIKEGKWLSASNLAYLYGVDGRDNPPEFAPADEGCLVGGDMWECDKAKASLLQEAIKAGKLYAGKLWPDPNSIPYCFMRGIPESVKDAVQAAVQHFKDVVPCINFVEINAGTQNCVTNPAIFIQATEAGCFASVGMVQNGITKLNLDVNGCDNMGTAVHELGHNLGMLHEQMRPDAFDHIKILWQNVRPGMEPNFAQDQRADRVQAYDITSVMHYADEAFTKERGLKTITLKDGSSAKMGQRMGLSYQDARQIADMYNCGGVTTFKLCTTDPQGCTTEMCTCVEDPSDSENGVVKVVDGTCKRCLQRCNQYPSFNNDKHCSCPQASRRITHPSIDGYFACCDPTDPTYPCPTPRPTPPSPSPMAPAPSLACADGENFCKPKYQKYCPNQVGGLIYTINGQKLVEACPKMCGVC